MPSTIWHWKLPFSHFAIEIISLAYDDGFLFQLQLITRTASSSQTTSRLELDSMMGDSKASRQPIFNSSGLILLITSLANLFPTSGALWSTYF
jgi:hypothetical protein